MSKSLDGDGYERWKVTETSGDQENWNLIFLG